MTDDHDALGRIGPAFLDGYIVVDKDRHITSFNPMFGQMLDLRGGDRRKLLNTNCCEYLHLEVCREQCMALECIKKNVPLRLQEIRAQTPQGREFIFEVNTLPLKDEKEKVTGALVVYRDVTDERKLKTRFMEEQTEHKKERVELLKIIEAREVEIETGRKK